MKKKYRIFSKEELIKESVIGIVSGVAGGAIVFEWTLLLHPHKSVTFSSLILNFLLFVVSAAIIIILVIGFVVRYFAKD